MQINATCDGRKSTSKAKAKAKASLQYNVVKHGNQTPSLHITPKNSVKKEEPRIASHGK